MPKDRSQHRWRAAPGRLAGFAGIRDQNDRALVTMDDAKARGIIAARRENVAQQLARFRSEAQAAESADRDIGDPVDTSQLLQAQDENAALIEGLEREWTRLEDALARLDAGNYGRCEVCGDEIEDERLEMLPWTRRDAKHAPDPDNGT
jgi:DnaK suppressor protein